MNISPLASRRWQLAAIVFAAAAIASSTIGASAAETASTPSNSSLPAPTPPTPSASTNDPVTSASVPMQPMGRLPYSQRDPLAMDRDFSREPPSRPWILPVFFPPTPPSLGAPIPFANPMLLASERAPTTLEPYVNEIFYAPLGTRMLDHRLSRRQEEKLKAYHDEKLELQKALRAKLAEVRLLPPAERLVALEAFARLQTPRIAALEKIAEEFRAELVRGEFFQSSVDWNITRDWKLESSRFYTVDDALNAQYQVLRAAPFYQKGLLPEQRGMLREIAIELREVGARRKSNDEDIVNPPLFFLPATSRLRLPPGLPGSLMDKIATFEREKSALKDELKTVLFAQDRAFFSSTRMHALEVLAEKQWPRIATLEEMAEDIRREFARLPEAIGPPAPPPLPAALAARISAFLDEKTQMQQDILAKIGQIKKDYGVQRVLPGKGGGTSGDLRLVINPGAQSEEKMAALRAMLNSFNDEMAARQKSLRLEEEAIRREFARSVQARAGGPSLEALLSDYAEALMQRDDWSRYGDYQMAMMTPGLSPEQRRLLFDGAVEKLNLPLPGWDLTSVRVIQ